ncbi:hypothetical protein EDB83DRAFT_930685 [Lactarius deliciosus]|nr:hypothetical protein EDB83DRAFT_930685 [Lactarius deliciosus]
MAHFSIPFWPAVQLGFGTHGPSLYRSLPGHLVPSTGYAWALETVIWGPGKSVSCSCVSPWQQGDKTSAFTYRVRFHSQVLSRRFHRSVPLYPFIEEAPSTDTETHTGDFQREMRLYLIAGAKSLHSAVSNAPREQLTIRQDPPGIFQRKVTGKGGRPGLGNVLPCVQTTQVTHLLHRPRIAFWTARKRRLSWSAGHPLWTDRKLWESGSHL